jgi:hypothetical protein
MAPSQLLLQYLARHGSQAEVGEFYHSPLEEFNVGVQLLGLLFTRVLDVIQRLIAVYMRLTSAKQIEIRAVDDQNCLLSVTHYRL